MRLQSVIDHDAVTAPCQERSQRTLERILAALAELLAEKSFDRIAMTELAERAGCSVTSIYARFKDKWSMIAALHESFRDDAMGRVDTFLAPERWKGAEADAILAAAAEALVAAYLEQRHLMRAVALTDDPKVYARAASLQQHVAERLVQVLPRPAGAAADAFAKRVHFAVHAAVAVLMQAVLFDEGAAEPLPRFDADLAGQLSDLMTSYVESPRGSDRAAGKKKKAR